MFVSPSENTLRSCLVWSLVRIKREWATEKKEHSQNVLCPLMAYSKQKVGNKETPQYHDDHTRAQLLSTTEGGKWNQTPFRKNKNTTFNNISAFLGASALVEEYKNNDYPVT